MSSKKEARAVDERAAKEQARGLDDCRRALKEAEKELKQCAEVERGVLRDLLRSDALMRRQQTGSAALPPPRKSGPAGHRLRELAGDAWKKGAWTNAPCGGPFPSPPSVPRADAIAQPNKERLEYLSSPRGGPQKPGP
eukprot:gene23204-6931_t